MKRNCCFLFSAFFCAVAFSMPNVAPPANIHPRLLFTAEKILEIKANLAHEENEVAYKYVLEVKKSLSVSGFAPEKFEKTEYKGKKLSWNGNLIAKIECAAFLAALETDKKYAEYAYETVMNCSKTIEVSNVYDDYRPIGHLIFTMAEVYDWCYNFLSKKQKTAILKAFETLAPKMQVGWPPEKQGNVTGHGSEGQILRDYLAFSIATYDERPDIWKKVSARFYDEMVVARLFFYDSLLPSFQGSNYGPYRTIFDLWSYFLIVSMGLDDPYNGKIEKWAGNYLHYRRPDGAFWILGDDTLSRDMKGGRNSHNYRLGVNVFLSAAITKNAFLKQKAFEILDSVGYKKKFKFNVGEGTNEENLSPVQFLILNDVKLKPQVDGKLPLAKYIDYPGGEYFARSSWSDENAAAVHMKIGQVFQSNHEHLDFGTFEIFAGDILASTSGVYQSGSDYKGLPHTKAYYQQTIAHNCILVEPEKPDSEKYGGQIPAKETKILGEMKGNPLYERGKVLYHFDDLKDDGTGAVCISGDLTKCYPNAKKVVRSMAAIFTGKKEIPLLFFVYDYVLPKDEKSKAVFLLHSLTEPEILGNRAVIKTRNEKAHPQKLVVATLLPENAKMTKVGGEGRNFEIAGKNMASKYDLNEIAKKDAEFGWGRVEVRNTGETAMLNAMAVTLSDEDALKPELAQDENYCGAFYEIGGKKCGVMFSKHGDGKIQLISNE